VAQGKEGALCGDASRHPLSSGGSWAADAREAEFQPLRIRLAVVLIVDVLTTRPIAGGTAGGDRALLAEVEKSCGQGHVLRGGFTGKTS
jgi:hypothetical protein